MLCCLLLSFIFCKLYVVFKCLSELDSAGFSVDRPY